MSQESRDNAQRVKRSLENAQPHLEEAAKHAAGTGDKSLEQKVKKLANETTQTSQELGTKLNPKSG